MKALAGRAAAVLARSGLLAALERADRGTDRVRVVTYHRIDELDAEPDLDPGLVSATPRDFRAQMELVALRYTAISLEDLVAAHCGERALPQRAVLLTFDDGYQDFEKNAWPILREIGLPAVLFVPTSFPDAAGPGFWWDRLHAALTRTSEKQIDVAEVGALRLGDAQERRSAHRTLRTHAKSMPHADALAWIDALIDRLSEVPSLHRVLGWDALRKLAEEGLSVCSHGSLHALYTRLAPGELAVDLVASKARIETELGVMAPRAVLAYPAGACNAKVRKAAQDAGYELAFGGGRGMDRLPLRDPFSLMRMPVHRYGTALFRAQLRPSVSRLGRALIDGRARRSA